MTPRSSHGKAKKQRKPRQKGVRSEAESVENQVRKIGLEVEVLAVIVAIAIIVVIYMLFSWSYPVSDDIKQENDEELAVDTSCTAVNPGMTQQECDDYELKDRAIYGNLPELCDEIKTESIRENCKKFF